MQDQALLVVVDKKTIKYLVESKNGLLELPVRISFQYKIDDGAFVNGSMTSDLLYNKEAALRRLRKDEAIDLDSKIKVVADNALAEHLRYSGQLSGDVTLYEGQIDLGREEDSDDEPPEIYLP